MTDQGQTQPNPPRDGAQIWWRILPMLFFAVVAYLVLWLLFAGALLQYLARAFTGKFNDQVTTFNRRVSRYLGEVFGYLTMVQDDMPFPFNDFPEDDGKGEPVEPAPPPAPASPEPATEAPKPAAKPAATKPAARKPAARKSSPASKTSGTAKPAAKPRRRAAPKKPPAENSES